MIVKLQKQMIVGYFLPFIVLICVQIIYYLTGCKFIELVFLCIVLELLSILFLLKERLLFSPSLLSDIYLLCMLIYQLKLVKSYKDLSFLCVFTILICMFFWKIINIYDCHTIKSNSKKNDFVFNLNVKKFKRIIVILFVVATFFTLLEWQHAGGIPALRPDGETFRFTVSINGVTHILAIMNKIVAVFVLSYFICKKKISLFKDCVLFVILFLSTLLIFFSNMRGELIIILFSGIVLFYIKYKPKFYKIILFALPLLILIGIIPVWRKYGLYGFQFVLDQKAISTYPNFWFLTPMYQTFADSIRVLNIVIEMIPSRFNFGIFEYSVLTQIPFLDLGADLSGNIAEFTNNYFYSGLTSTYLGPAYADGGILGAILYTIIFAFWGKWAYKKYVSYRTYKYTLLYVFTIYQIYMLSYGTMMDLSFFVYYFLIYFICTITEERGYKK